MNHKTVSRMILLPRTIGLIYLLFLMLFSFDVFNSAAVTANEILAFAIHSLPSVILLILMIVTWHRPLWAGALFVAFAGVITAVFHTYGSMDMLILITLPPVVAAVLFFATDQRTRRLLKKEAELPQETTEMNEEDTPSEES